MAADDLDWDPPAVVLDALAERTGVDRNELRAMTVAGWVPWLLDTLEPSGDPAAFDTYVRQDSVLLPASEAKRRQVCRWRPWLPAKPMRRACPTCASFPDRGLTLISQLPIVISCPEHACRLMPEVDIAIAAAMNERLSPTPVNAHIAALDRLTLEGFTTGQVTLPLRPVHLGVWFRLLSLCGAVALVLMVVVVPAQASGSSGALGSESQAARSLASQAGVAPR
ncbi:MAG: TniQ family protein [Actinomycetota bacterium]|nr:TniQ family protein [Actinomycetota bacterium]